MREAPIFPFLYLLDFLFLPLDLVSAVKKWILRVIGSPPKSTHRVWKYLNVAWTLFVAYLEAAGHQLATNTSQFCSAPCRG